MLGIHHVTRESGFHDRSPVVASRSFLGMPSASTLTRRPTPGPFAFRISRTEGFSRHGDLWLTDFEVGRSRSLRIRTRAENLWCCRVRIPAVQHNCEDTNNKSTELEKTSGQPGKPSSRFPLAMPNYSPFGLHRTMWVTGKTNRSPDRAHPNRRRVSKSRRPTVTFARLPSVSTA